MQADGGTALPDIVQLSVPHGLAVRCLRGHTRSGVLRRLSVLHHIHAPDLRSVLRPASSTDVDTVRKGTLRHEQILQRGFRVLDERLNGRSGWVYLDLDAVLWPGSCVTGVPRAALSAYGRFGLRVYDCRRLILREVAMAGLARM